MEFLKFLISKYFLKNLIIAASITIGIIAIVFLGLHIFTKHNQSITVPDFSGLNKEEVEIISNSKKLRFEIIDSIFYRELPKGTVAKQNPKAGDKVKENRRIYLTMNAVNPEKITMPTLTGVSLRQARAILETYGFVLGKISYQPDIAVNVVLKQKYLDSLIVPGTIISKGSEIDLVLGKGLSNKRTLVPNLIGFSYTMAKDYLTDRYLNIGGIIYDSSIENGEDSSTSVIWKQLPMYDETAQLQLGSQVDIFLTVDSTKLPQPDSLLIENDIDITESLIND